MKYGFLKWKPKNRTTFSFQVILLGFLGLILLGALILTLPICSRDRSWTSAGTCWKQTA